MKKLLVLFTFVMIFFEGCASLSKPALLKTAPKDSKTLGWIYVKSAPMTSSFSDATMYYCFLLKGDNKKPVCVKAKVFK